MNASVTEGSSLLHSGGRSRPQLDHGMDPNFAYKIVGLSLQSIFNKNNIINKSLKMLLWLE